MLVDDLVEAIPEYTRLGFVLVPMRGKKPAVCWDQASIDPQVVQGMVRGMHGITGIGVLCGPSRLVVVDVDGPLGRAFIEDRRATGHELPATLTQISGRADGGQHFLYRCDDDSVPTRSRKKFGIDVRADRGVLVLAPSKHPRGGRYRTDWASIAAVPRWLADWAKDDLAVVGEPRPRAKSDSISTVAQAGRSSAASHLPDTVQRMLAECRVGQRSEALFGASAAMVRLGMTDDQIASTIVSSPVGAKTVGKPLSWLQRDVQRARAAVDRVDQDLDRVAQWAGANAAVFGSRTRSTDVAVLTACVALARIAGTQRPALPIRSLTILTSKRKETVGKALHRLVAADAIRLVERARGVKASVYELLLPNDDLQHDADRSGRSEAVLGSVHDVFGWRGLGLTAARLYALLETPASIRELGAALACSARTARTNTGRLVGAGLARRLLDGTFVRTDRSLDSAAEQINAPAVRERRIQQAEYERWLFHEYMAPFLRRAALRERHVHGLAALRGHLLTRRVAHWERFEPATGEVFATYDLDWEQVA